MACINPDGTLTMAGRDVLGALSEPRTVEEIHEIARQPVYRVRASLREMESMGLITVDGDRYAINEAGKARLDASNG
jgi:predicted transcriptional regulator